ncbi:MAG TPA: phosphate ABC transporter substrate-binding protein PstS [Candidatus Acidoferrales bacterium]|nr:phosphate ABC transporter substrate-binding protein PstS [Candidatus Acidoferrales bacterium]
MKPKYVIIGAVVLAIIIIASIGSYTLLSQPGTGTEKVQLNGSGASFPYPLLNSIITEYTTNIKTNVQVNYQSVGSGAGVTAVKEKTVDFAASDAPLSATESASIANVLHIPETIGAVTVTYNLPGVSSGLKLNGQVIADIFEGKITKWNDAAIQSLNPTITLPDQTITTVHRSDGSGTTYIFTTYLSMVSNSWGTNIGAAKSVSWPNGLGSSGNTGVAQTITGTQYSIGYVELAYTIENNMSVAAVQNPAGNYVLPTLASTTAAAQAGASSLPAGSASWTSVSLLNTSAEDAYPIASFTYIIVYKELNVIPGMTEAKATALVQFLWYVVHNGQNVAPSLQYAALPSGVVTIDEATIQSITFNGQTLPTS